MLAVDLLLVACFLILFFILGSIVEHQFASAVPSALIIKYDMVFGSVLAIILYAMHYFNRVFIYREVVCSTTP